MDAKMNKDEARHILANSFTESKNPIALALSLGRKHKSARLNFIGSNDPDLQLEKEISACIEITRYWRGFTCRNTLKKLFTTVDRNVKVSKVVINPPVTPASSVTSHGSKATKASSQKVHTQKSNDITKVTRPRSLKKPKSQTISTLPIEKKENNAETTKINVNFSKHDAAVVIQKAWRRHIDTQVFRYYQALINFHGQGDPAAMLRCINPLESKLLDSAAGIHIKFRLAGEKFPPNIYYKIFTHRPIVDMCANSPKDYTKASAKQPMGKQVHSKHLPLNDHPNMNDWYKRVENNGWRLVSDRLIHAAMDPTTWETSQKKVEFHYSKPMRKADLDKKRRQRKIQWMQKMYRQGMLKAKQTDEETNDLVERAAHGLSTTIHEQGEGAVMEWEIDELLQWTTALNFDDYLESWKESATSGVSENAIPLPHNKILGATVQGTIPVSFDPYALTRTSSGVQAQDNERFLASSSQDNNFDAVYSKESLRKQTLVT